jgi:hypothetical protein
VNPLREERIRLHPLSAVFKAQKDLAKVGRCEVWAESWMGKDFKPKLCNYHVCELWTGVVMQENVTICQSFGPYCRLHRVVQRVTSDTSQRLSSFKVMFQNTRLRDLENC